MLKMLQQKNTFYCFTPEVMLATLVIEIILAVYTFARYRMTSFGVVASAILLLLAIFQIAEYQVCTGDASQLFWARVGMIAITLLPALGLNLIFLVNNTTHLLKVVYIVAVVSVVFFGFSPFAITDSVCGGNYVIFKSDLHQFFKIYTLYYFALLFTGIWHIYEQILNNSHDKRKKEVLYWLFFGYISFILPTAIVYGLYESTLQGMISIMCGFAVIFALILALRVVPIYHRKD